MAQTGAAALFASTPLVFPVRKRETGWIDASTKKLVDIAPTHWRPWRENEGDVAELQRSNTNHLMMASEVIPGPSGRALPD